MLLAPLAGRVPLVQAQEDQLEPAQQQNVWYFPLIEGPGQIQIVNAGANAAQCTLQFFNPDGTPKRDEQIEIDGRPVRLNRNGEATVTTPSNASTDCRIPGDEDNPIRCWVCIRCGQPNVHSFAKVTRRTVTGRVPLIYPCCQAGRFFTIQFGGLCPVQDQILCVSNTQSSASQFFLVLYRKDGQIAALRELRLEARNCRCLSLPEIFPEYSSSFNGWLFAQSVGADVAIKCYGTDLSGNIFTVPVV